MNLPNEEIAALLNKAESKLKTAHIDFDNGRYDDSVSRAYYAVFHSMTAALLTKGMAFSSHGQVIGSFNREFIKSGSLPGDFTGFIQGLFADRQAGDYDAIAVIDKATAGDHISNAETILNAVKSLCAIPGA